MIIMYLELILILKQKWLFVGKKRFASNTQQKMSFKSFQFKYLLCSKSDAPLTLYHLISLSVLLK